MSLDDPRVTTATDTGSTACKTTFYYGVHTVATGPFQGENALADVTFNVPARFLISLQLGKLKPYLRAKVGQP